MYNGTPFSIEKVSAASGGARTRDRWISMPAFHLLSYRGFYIWVVVYCFDIVCPIVSSLSHSGTVVKGDNRAVSPGCKEKQEQKWQNCFKHGIFVFLYSAKISISLFIHFPPTTPNTNPPVNFARIYSANLEQSMFCNGRKYKNNSNGIISPVVA